MHGSFIYGLTYFGEKLYIFNAVKRRLTPLKEEMRMVIAYDVTELIGNTPIIRINKLTKSTSARVLAKLEGNNIGGSVKDRMAKSLIEYAEAAGKLDKRKTILEATSGNTGIALAMISAAKGYHITVTMPESVSIERRKLIKAYGAELLLTPKKKGTAGAIEYKHQLLEENPEKYIDINQFKDPANILAHYQTTGKEIINQTNGKVDAVVVGVGTAGTGVGISLILKQYNPNIQIIGVIPQLGKPIQGLRNPGEAYSTELFRQEHFDEIVEILGEEKNEYYKIGRRAAKEEGLLIGISSAAILYVALRKAEELGSGKTVVAILPDSGMKYLSTDLFED
jgi:cysteine synthase